MILESLSEELLMLVLESNAVIEEGGHKQSEAQVFVLFSNIS